MAWRDLRIVCAGWVLAIASAHAAVGITPPNLSGATAGSLPGAVSVSPKGTAGYSIPLAVPPGTAGMAPAVALEYDSQAGMDMLGLGWKVAGQSKITRCGKTRAVDGAARGVMLDAQDPFCLDGQRLLLVSGTHGATAWYRTEVDGIARIRSYGSDANNGPDSWTVELKDGRKQSYGTNAGSLFVAPGKTTRLTWAISRAEDRYGNYLSYHYVDGEATGEFYLTKIRYTGNDNASPALVPYNAINFIYEDRPDTWSGYVMNSKLWRLKRLTNIQVRINTAADGSGGTFKREFRIAYETSVASDRSLVTSVSDCGPGSACLPATSFEYSTRNAAHNTFHAAGSGVWSGPTGIVIKLPETTYGTETQQLQKMVLQGDADGDGKSDLLYSTGNGTWQVCKSTGSAFSCSNWAGPAVSPEYAITGDFNRDGRTDIAVVPSASGVTSWTVCVSTGTAFSCGTSSAQARGRNSFNSHRIADYTGDGRDDLLVLGQQEAGEITWLCPANSSGTGFTTCRAYDQAYAFGLEFTDADYKQRVFPLQADFNGDGRIDAFKLTTWTYYGNYEIFLAGDTGFMPAGNSGKYTIPFSPSPYGVADFNQDGYVDLTNGNVMAVPQNGTAYKVETCRYRGTELGCLQEEVSADDRIYATPGWAGTWDGTDTPTLTASAYINGAYLTGVVRVLPAAGQHRNFVEWSAAPLMTEDDGTMQPADVNGDGLLDVIRYNRISQKWSVYLAGRGSHPDLLSKVTNGYGHDTVVEYKGLYDSTVYARGVDVAWPKRNSTTGSAVVSRVRVEANSGEAANQWIDTNYTYSGLRSDMEGRGSLGFEKVNAAAETVNSAGQPTTITTTTTYSQDFPTTGLPSSVVTKHSDGTVLSQTTNTLTSFETTAGAQYPYVRLSTVTRKDLNGSALPTIVTRVGTSGSTTDGIDIYGNVTKLQETITDGSDIFATVTDSIYSNNATTWLLGLRTDMTVKKSAPGVSDVTRTLKSVFNGSGRLTSDTLEPNNTALKLETVYGVHSAYGVPTTKTLKWHDPQANAAKSRVVETLLYDAKHRYPETVKNAKNQQEERTYDEATGSLLTLKGPNLLTTEWAYDLWGRKTREDRPDGTATTWAYKTCVDTCGYGNTAVAVTIEQQWAVIGGVDEQTVVPKETFFDALGRQVFARSWDYRAGWLAADSVYDALGRLRKSSSPHTWADRAANRVGWTLFTRDDLGRPTKIETTNQTGDGFDTTNIVYAGQSTTTTNAKSQDRTEVANGLGKLKRATDANGKATIYVYDPWGNLKTTTDPLGNQIKVAYDTLGRKTQLDDPDLGTWNYKVNPLGQTYEQTDAKLQKTTFTFDELGRLTDRVEVDQQSHWVYDTASKGIGKLAEAYTGPSTDKDYQRIHSYDTLGRPSKVITRLDWDYSTIYGYNSYSQVDTLTHRRNTIGATGGSSHQVYNLTYNNQGAIYQIKRNSSALLWTRNSHDAQGRTTKETFGSGLITQRDFNDWTGRIQSIETGTVDANSVFTPGTQDDAYTYDSLGNLLTRSQLVAAGGAVVQDTFTYDALNRLWTTKVGSNAAVTMGYDELGNVKSKPWVGTYSYPASGASSVRPHAVTSITGTVAGLTNPGFSYDDNGNLKLGLNRGYQWSASNYPLKIDKLTNGNLTSAVERTGFVYGPDRQRTKQVVRTMAGQTEGAVKRTIYYGGEIEKEVDITLNKTFIRTYLPQGLGFTQETINGIATPADTSSALTRFFHKDHLGSPSVITGLDGSELQRMSYDAWGRRRYASGANDSWSGLGTLSNAQDNTGYTGEEQLDQMGLVHLNGRVYDPIAARMISADPTVPNTRNLQSLNRFSYVDNSPLNYVDPTGFSPESDIAQVVIQDVRGNGFEIYGNPMAMGSGGMGAGGARGVLYGRLPMGGPFIALGAAPGTPAQSAFVRLMGKLGDQLASAATVAENLVKVLAAAVGGDQGSDAEEAVGANSSSPETPPPDDGKKRPKETDHSKQRANEAKTDANRSVGDRNAVVRDGQKYIDDLTGNNVHVSGDRVVITDQEGNFVSQFKNTRANTNARIESGRWIPAPPPGL